MDRGITINKCDKVKISEIHNKLWMWSVFKNTKHMQKVLNAEFIRPTFHDITPHHQSNYKADYDRRDQKVLFLNLKDIPSKKYWVCCWPKKTPKHSSYQVQHALHLCKAYAIILLRSGKSVLPYTSIYLRASPSSSPTHSIIWTDVLVMPPHWAKCLPGNI
jgi:hypothetical protein